MLVALEDQQIPCLREFTVQQDPNTQSLKDVCE